MTIQERFNQFHANNPQVKQLILRFVAEAHRRGYKAYSINGIFERIRWHINMETVEDSDKKFKLSNNYRSRYVRLIEQELPELKGFFHTRTLRTD